MESSKLLDGLGTTCKWYWRIFGIRFRQPIIRTPEKLKEKTRVSRTWEVTQNTLPHIWHVPHGTSMTHLCKSFCLEEAVAFLFEITPRKTSPTRNHPSRLDGFINYTHHDMPTDAHYATMSHFPEIPTCIRAKPACTRRQRSSCDVTTWVDKPANNTRLTKSPMGMLKSKVKGWFIRVEGFWLQPLNCFMDVS